MAFESQLLDGEIIYDDSTPDEVAAQVPEGFSKGREGTSGYSAVPDTFPQSLLIPRGEWQARIQEMEEQKSRLSDIINQAGLPCKNQATSNFCWGNAPTHAAEVLRVVQNQEMVILSPASVCAPIKGFRNQGGWGEEALQWIVDKGIVPVDKWPANAIDRQYYTAGNQQLALDFRVVEWWRLQPRNIDQQISCLLRRIPVAVGLNYWSHEVLDVDPVWINGQIGVRFRNSWGMDWPGTGAGGYSIRQGNKMPGDDAVAPRTATTSVRTTSEPVAAV